MALDFGKVKEKYTPSEVAAYKDSQVLLEKSLPDLTKLDLTKLNEKNTLRALSDSHAEMISFVKRLGSMTQSIQDYLIELSVKVDDLKAGLQAANHTPTKPKMTREQLFKFKSETAKKLQESKRAERIKNIKAMQAKHPEFAKNAAVIAGLSGVGVKTVEKYMEQGLV